MRRSPDTLKYSEGKRTALERGNREGWLQDAHQSPWGLQRQNRQEKQGVVGKAANQTQPKHLGCSNYFIKASTQRMKWVVGKPGYTTHPITLAAAKASAQVAQGTRGATLGIR